MFITRLEKDTILERLRNLEQAVLRFTLRAQSEESKSKPGRPKTAASTDSVERRRAYARAYYKGKKAAQQSQVVVKNENEEVVDKWAFDKTKDVSQ